MRWVDWQWLQGGRHMVSRAGEAFLTRRERHRPVRYGDREFTVPQLLSEAALPRGPAIYAIQVPHWWSGLKPIHFGAAHDLHDELLQSGHEGFVHWLGHGGARRGVYVSFHLLAAHEAEGRHRATAHLNRHFFPRRSHSFEEHLDLHGIHRSPEHRRHVHDHAAHGAHAHTGLGDSHT